MIDSTMKEEIKQIVIETLREELPNLLSGMEDGYAMNEEDVEPKEDSEEMAMELAKAKVGR